MPLTQENRRLSIETPLGPDVLVLTSLAGTEGISTPFEYELGLASQERAIATADIVGHNVTLSIALPDDETRFINGYVSRFSQEQEGELPGEERPVHVTRYSARLVPWTWFLTRTTNHRIFQAKTVQQIVEQIFREKEFADYEFRLRGSYEPREYCVQYRETDFAFISRLLEQEGIFYFFEHEDGRHLLVLADSADEHQDCPHQETARCQLTAGTELEEDVITALAWGQEIRFGKYTTRDYNFLMPATDLKVEVPTRMTMGSGEREQYDYPGNYRTRNEGTRYADLRMQAEEARVTTITGSSTCRAFASGYRFTLKDYYRDDMNNMPYLITEVTHASSETVGGSVEQAEMTYSNTFTCIPFDVPFRPQLATPRPVVVGVQTGIVTGPDNEEIYTDEHGRVKVKFHWDRDPARDETTSCWVRVAQLWAGQGWGAMWIPRIGHEVVVSFIEGDPDRPIVIGSVYHATNVPPYPLPEDKTRSTIKSSSSMGGGGYNEIRFEDLKGKEEIWVHGQKDWNILIENNKNQTIGVNETKRVGVNETVTIGANRSVTVGLNKTETVAENKAETIGIAKELTIGGAYQVTVGAAMNETVGAAKGEEIGKNKIVVVGGRSTETIGQDRKVDVGGHLTENAGKNVTIHANGNVGLSSGGNTVIEVGKKGTIEVEEELTIKVGEASITFKKNGDISIEGKKINIKGSGDITMKGSKIRGN